MCIVRASRIESERTSLSDAASTSPGHVTQRVARPVGDLARAAYFVAEADRWVAAGK